MFSRVIDCSFPTKEELDGIGSKERLNLFRRYFAAMRYNRLLIQQCLIKSAYDESSIPRVEELERLHNLDFINKVKIVKEYGFIDEFVHGVKEEEQALQKIIEAYDKRINQFFRWGSVIMGYFIVKDKVNSSHFMLSMSHILLSL